jgi:hypothetical protein
MRIQRRALHFSVQRSGPYTRWAVQNGLEDDFTNDESLSDDESTLCADATTLPAHG